MTGEAWVGLIAVGVTVLFAVVASYVSLSTKLARLETSLNGLNTRDRENREEHSRIWDKLDNHGNRITRLEPTE